MKVHNPIVNTLLLYFKRPLNFIIIIIFIAVYSLSIKFQGNIIIINIIIIIIAVESHLMKVQGMSFHFKLELKAFCLTKGSECYPSFSSACTEFIFCKVHTTYSLIEIIIIKHIYSI